MASEHPEFGTTLARRLNRSRASAVLQSNLIAIKFGMAEARRLNWALEFALYVLHTKCRIRPIPTGIAPFLLLLT